MKNTWRLTIKARGLRIDSGAFMVGCLSARALARLRSKIKVTFQRDFRR